MKLDIRPYTPELTEAVKLFNRRLGAKGVTFQFPESHIPAWLPRVGDRPLYQEYFVAIDETFSVRGAYILKHQEFQIGEDIMSVGNYQLPLSEGTIDRSYNLVGLRLLTHALKRQTYLYALGMGGMNRPLPKFLKSMGWSLQPVPFCFKVINPYRFLRGIAFLRNTFWRRVALDVAAVTGLGWLAVKLSGLPGIKASHRDRQTTVEVVGAFGDWADLLWHEAGKRFAFAAVRDAAVLGVLYPAHDKRFIRLKVMDEHRVVGWAVLLDTPMENHKQFGHLRVGTIVDCLALPGFEPDVARAAERFLESRRVDLIITNQAHPAWVTALGGCGFHTGPSNFIFASSPGLTERVSRATGGLSNLHLNRGDGDGPIHL